MDELVSTSVQSLTSEILLLKAQTAQNIIEIGKRLIAVKEQLQHGEWLPWLENSVGFSQRSAYNFITIAKQEGNLQSLASLGTTKVFALLELPPDDREAFVSTPQPLPNGETKTVEDMTTRELQAAIKAKKDAEAKADVLQRQFDSVQHDYRKLKETAQQAIFEAEQLKQAPAKVVEVEKIVEVKIKDEQAIKDAETLRALLTDAENELADISAEAGDLKTIEAKKRELETQMRNLRAELLRLRERNDLAAREAYITSLLRTAAKPLKEGCTELLRAIKQANGLTDLTKRHMASEIEACGNILVQISEAMNTVEVLPEQWQAQQA